MDASTLKWENFYAVLTEDGLYLSGHGRGVGTPLRFRLTPNSLVFVTTLKEQSFELVLFSESLHLNALSDDERNEWIYALQCLTSSSKYDETDPLQMASIEKKLEFTSTEFISDVQDGMMLERRGNWAIASVVSEAISQKVSKGSVLYKIGNERVMMKGFDAVVDGLSRWKPPLQLSFILTRKMGWLLLKVKQPSSIWLNMIGKKRKDEAIWGEHGLSVCM